MQLEKQVDSSAGSSSSSFSLLLASGGRLNQERRSSSCSVFNINAMMMAVLTVALIFLSLASSAESANESPSNNGACPFEQIEVTPCRCCKMDCWYSVAKGATHELGHIPGQEGEDEAMATLKLIRACMISQCSSVCPAAAPRLFRPMPMNGLGMQNNRDISQLVGSRPRPLIPMI